MRIASRLTLRLPAMAWLRDRLVRTRFVLVPDRQPLPLPESVGGLHHLFFPAVSGSLTVTTPLSRRRCTVPVSHQVRFACQESPACRSTHQTVWRLTGASPFLPRARWSVESDQ